MSAQLPIAVYGLRVPAGDLMVPAHLDLPGTFRITMAAIDPSAPPNYSGTANGDTPPRATLKIIYDPSGPLYDDDFSQESDEELLESMMDDDELSSEEEGKNGGPSDPSKTQKARKQAAAEEMMKALASKDSDSDDDMIVDGHPKANGVLSTLNKGKGKANEDFGVSSDEEEEEDLDGMEELVLCTLDPTKNYQQPLDIAIGEYQHAFFKVSGTHAVHLTGNYLMPADDGGNHRHDSYDDDDEEDFDYSPDVGELGGSSESDELDDLQDPRVTELSSEDEEPPTLLKKHEFAKGNKKTEPRKGDNKEESENAGKNDEPEEATKIEEPGKGNKKDESGKGNKKRAAEESDEEPANLDEIMAKALKPIETLKNEEPKLSKKQLKKLKNNAGKAVEAAIENKIVEKLDEVAKDKANSKGDKKVQFAKHLEQGPSPTASESKTKNRAEATADVKKNGDQHKTTLGKKTVQGIDIDDKKLGKGPAAKNGSKVSMRYIGKLQDGKVFDANKKGTPFSCTLGIGDVIKGWDIGVVGMSAGGERRITVPAHHAYGNQAKPGIPANSTLIFDIKMLEVR